MNVAPVSEATVDILAFHPYIHLLPLLILQSGWRGGSNLTSLDISQQPPLASVVMHGYGILSPCGTPKMAQQKMSLHPPIDAATSSNFNSGEKCAFKRAAVGAQKT